MGRFDKTPSITRQKTATAFVILFFSFCIFQAYGEQENWPFSYFGMYKKNPSRYNLSRADVEVATSDGKLVNTYNLGVNAYYLEENFRKILYSQKDSAGNPIEMESDDGASTLLQKSPQVVEQLEKALREDIVPILEKNKIDPNGIVRVRFRLWRYFEVEKRWTPDVNEVYVEKRWRDL